ncbi:NAD(P)H-dependent oxidoreductase [Pseudorhodoferax sp. Leaf274]|uniref:NAD(P)H-dependent oxidoreductase n=1 Tax=Pseudorhodoferax sp. Leaf274 TaxID=1736318 RepID=UPI0009E859CC|nr:NAD(P)H-dependent oxidoreductase [Pseudorhodoferax sp. Leaf274]
MKVLIVFAHPEPKSFGRALLDRSVETLRGCGHAVAVSDLYAMRFNPIAAGEDFIERRFPDALQYDREQKQASQRRTFTSDIQTEIDKLQACDLLILQFPLWWFSVPAIMKGWIDRVFANGTAYGAGGMRFDQGGFKGKKAMLAFTTGCFPDMMEPDGLLGQRDVVLWHLQHGTFGYSGLQVLQPFVGWSLQYSDEAQRHTYLDAYAERLRGIEHEAVMPTHPLADFTPAWRLKPEIAPRTAGHRRPGHST